MRRSPTPTQEDLELARIIQQMKGGSSSPRSKKGKGAELPAYWVFAKWAAPRVAIFLVRWWRMFPAAAATLLAVVVVSDLHHSAPWAAPLGLIAGAGVAWLMWVRSEVEDTYPIRVPRRLGLAASRWEPVQRLLRDGFPCRAVRPALAAAAGLWLTVAWWVSGYVPVLVVPVGVAVFAVVKLTARPKAEKAPSRRHVPSVDELVKAWPQLTAPQTPGAALGLGESEVHGPTMDDVGWRLPLELGASMTRGQIGDKLDKVESLLNQREGTLRIEPSEDRRARSCILRAVTKDVLADPVLWPGTETRTILDPLHIGTFEEGTKASLSFVPGPGKGRSMFLTGKSGAGKSSTINLFAAVLAGCGDVALAGMDPEGTELRDWEGVFEPGWLALDGGECEALMARVLIYREQRRQIMVTRGWKEWQPSPEDPELYLLVDEMASIPGLMGDISRLASIGRKTGIHIIGATQRPTNKLLGEWATSILANVQIRACMGVNGPREVNIALGDGAAGEGWRADLLCRAQGDILIRCDDVGFDAPRRIRTLLYPTCQGWEERLSANRPSLRAAA